MSKVLGDYKLAPEVDDALNNDVGDMAYMVLSSADEDGAEYGEPSFSNTLGHAHSSADWAGTNGKRSIVVCLENMIFTPWDKLPVVYDNTDED